jgi:hypothetical protein
MDNITSAVKELWEFLVPPLFKVAVAIGLLAWLARPVFKGLLSRARDAAEKVRSDAETHPLVKSLGLEKLIPAVGLFMIVLVIYAGNELILGIGWGLPIDIVTIQPASLLHHTSEERLLLLWSQHPDAEFWDLPAALESDLHALTFSHSRDILSNVQHWEKTSAAVARWFYTGKFLLAFSILLCIIQLRRKLNPGMAVRRTIVAILVLSAALVFLSGQILYCHNQLLAAKYGVLAAALPSKDLQPTAMANLKDKLEKLEISQGKRSWWEVRFVDYYAWMTGVKYLTGYSLYNERKQNRTEQGVPPDSLRSR